MDQQTVTCPNCGYAVQVGTPICGNCGHQLGTPTSNAPLASRGGPPRGLVLLFIVLVLGALVWGLTDKIGDFFRSATLDGVTGVLEPNVIDIDEVESPYGTVRALAAALNEGGLRCRQVKVDHADEYVATGSCQVRGRRIAQTHVQINIFFEETSLRAVAKQMRDGAFTYVHDANWFVITLNPTARRVHNILGGKISLAK